MKDKTLYRVFLTQPSKTSFAVRQGDTALLSILNKTLKTMPSSLLTGALAMYDSAPEKVTAADFVKDNLTTASAVFILLSLLLFGLFRALSNVYFGFSFLVSLNIPSGVYNMLPYVISLIVLAFTSKNSRAPKAEGIPYDKGMR